MCGVLSGLDTPRDLVIYAENKGNYLWEALGIKNVPAKATFGRILSMIDGKQIGEAILEILHQRFGTDGEVIAVDGKAIRNSSKDGNSHRALQILSAYLTNSSVTLAQEPFAKRRIKYPYFKKCSHI